MFRKTVIALAAIATLGTAAVTPTTASAGWKKWHHHHHYHRRGWGYYGPALVAGAIVTGAVIASSCYRTRWVDTPYGWRRVRINVC
jgi:hypothetical protein